LEWVSYIRSHLFEILAVAFSLISVLLTIKENLWLWITGIFGVLFYALVFWQEKFYAQMGLQVFFIGLQIYGWNQWLRGGTNKNRIPISRPSVQLNTLLFVVAIAGTWVMTFLLARLVGDASLPFWDALITVLSLIAQWMLAKKYLENWLVWITVDLISVGVYWYQGLRPSALLYTVFLVLAILGFFEWKKTYKGLQRA
jgi:nicotinamide mononucleotide transporter